MVRFIIKSRISILSSLKLFTFQYGQIYYPSKVGLFLFFFFIYIPIWLDLLSQLYTRKAIQSFYLHSNMVRFIIYRYSHRLAQYLPIYIPIWLDLLCFAIIVAPLSLLVFTFQYGQIYYPSHPKITKPGELIYIPIWLDLLLIFRQCYFLSSYYLHSNMVRFIIGLHESFISLKTKFTFQYGQIYYNGATMTAKQDEAIYIPIWLDLLFMPATS